MEYYVVGEDKSSAPAYKKDEVYNKAEINDKINDIDNSLNDKAEQSDVTALQAAVADKLGKDALQDYVPKTTTINGQPLSNSVELDYNNVGAAPEVHDHNTLYYTKSNIDSTVANINSKIDSKASLTVSTYTNKDQATAITLQTIDTGSWLVFDCRTTDTDGGSNHISDRRSIKLPGNSNERYMLITSHSTQNSVHEDIASGVYQGGTTFDNSYWDGTYTMYTGATYLNGVLLRLA